ncbi:MAG: methylated-DNA--[protein]-cysteine S-methyltransferase [Rhizobiaceae bacterium]|nr:methylated-DNA--[protein]-cysteine S-methyltransferase [Rhizobiaceae bacterium]
MSDQITSFPPGTQPGAFIFETALGFFSIAWSSAGITRCVLPEPSREVAKRRLSERGGMAGPLLESEAALPAPARAVVEAVRAYTEGDTTGFDDITLDLTGIDEFRLAIYAAARALGHGEVVTYGELAERAGYPGMARETGTALGRNPIPLIVPCHRIIAAGGKLGGFSARGGTDTKKRLLAHEHAAPPAANPDQGDFAF